VPVATENPQKRGAIATQAECFACYLLTCSQSNDCLLATKNHAQKKEATAKQAECLACCLLTCLLCKDYLFTGQNDWQAEYLACCLLTFLLCKNCLFAGRNSFAQVPAAIARQAECPACCLLTCLQCKDCLFTKLVAYRSKNTRPKKRNASDTVCWHIGYAKSLFTDKIVHRSEIADRCSVSKARKAQGLKLLTRTYYAMQFQSGVHIMHTQKIKQCKRELPQRKTQPVRGDNGCGCVAGL